MARRVLRPSVMRTHHAIFFLALAVGAVLAVVLTTASGLWLDLHRPLGSRGLLTFLVAAGVIVFVVELFAGLFGNWIEDRLDRRRAAP